METRYPVKKNILKLREDLENEILLDNKNQQKLLELSMELDELILLYMKDEM